VKAELRSEDTGNDTRTEARDHVRSIDRSIDRSSSSSLDLRDVTLASVTGRRRRLNIRGMLSEKALQGSR